MLVYKKDDLMRDNFARRMAELEKGNRDEGRDAGPPAPRPPLE